MAVVLVVDDEESFRTVLIGALENDGHVCAGVATAAEALRQANLRAPDVAIVGCNLRDSAGRALCVALMHLFPHLRAILTSSEPDSDLPIGVCLLSRPFRIDQLLRLIPPPPLGT